MVHRTYRYALPAALALLASSGVAFAETRSTVHNISQDTFVDNCLNMGGEAIEGDNSATCDLPSGTSAECSFEPAGSGDQFGVCVIETPRTADTSLKKLLGASPGGVNVGGGLTSGGDGGSSGGGSGGAVTGGKGDYAPGAGAGAGSMDPGGGGEID